MHVLYIDESGTPDVPGNTSHFVLVGVSVPIWHWKDADRDVSGIMANYGLEGKELHTAWLKRRYLEQSKIPGFEAMHWAERRTEAQRARNAHLLQLQKSNNRKAYRQAKKNYIKSQDYIHLTESERHQLVVDIANIVANWGFARLFGECIDKLYFDSAKTNRTISEQAFEQVVSRFERYLQNIHSPENNQRHYGILVHDNNETVAKKHTELMREFHQGGTLWTGIDRIIETPLFVDSRLTSMVQVADLCSFALRRYLENGETELLELIYPRADRFAERVVGVRHFSARSCRCNICQQHAAC